MACRIAEKTWSLLGKKSVGRVRNPHGTFGIGGVRHVRSQRELHEQGKPKPGNLSDAKVEAAPKVEAESKPNGKGAKKLFELKFEAWRAPSKAPTGPNVVQRLYIDFVIWLYRRLDEKDFDESEFLRGATQAFLVLMSSNPTNMQEQKQLYSKSVCVVCPSFYLC